MHRHLRKVLTLHASPCMLAPFPSAASTPCPRPYLTVPIPLPCSGGGGSGISAFVVSTAAQYAISAVGIAKPTASTLFNFLTASFTILPYFVLEAILAPLYAALTGTAALTSTALAGATALAGTSGDGF